MLVRECVFRAFLGRIITATPYMYTLAGIFRTFAKFAAVTGGKNFGRTSWVKVVIVLDLAVARSLGSTSVPRNISGVSSRCCAPVVIILSRYIDVYGKYLNQCISYFKI